MSKQLLPLPPFPLSLTYAYSYTDTHTLTPTAGQRHVELINKHTHAPCRSHTLLVTLRFIFLQQHSHSPRLSPRPSYSPLGSGHCGTQQDGRCCCCGCSWPPISHPIVSKASCSYVKAHGICVHPALHPHPAPACIPLARCPARDARCRGPLFIYLFPERQTLWSQDIARLYNDNNYISCLHPFS